MKAHFTIYLKIGEEEVNLSPYLSKNSVSFNSNLCSTGWKSVTDTASMTLTFNDRNATRLQEIFAYLVSAQQAFPPVAVNVRIAQGDTTVFRGKLDLGKLSVSSSKLPGTISLSAKSKMEELDVKPQNNFALWPGTVGDAVNRCLKELSLSSVSTWAPGIEKRGLEVPFVVTEDDSDTWRNRIDTLLCEMGGYVLTYDHATDTFAVSKVNDPNKEVPETFIKYLVSSQLKSGSTRFSKDGVVVVYRNVKSELDQIMYMKDISLSKDEATGDTVGEWVEPGAFFPEDADVTKTFEEYDSGILDRGNLLETSRKQNDHMGLYFLDPDTTKIEITASDENYKGVSDWYSNDSFYSPEGGFTYPKGGEFYPTKAWIALKNKTEGKINVTDFRISGKVWYSDAEYRMVMPIACKDPEEYSSSYISKQETAKEYANFLMNIKRFGGDTSTWTERWEEHSIGDKVLIRHKSGSTITAVIVRKQTRTMGDELWADMTAVSLDGWKLTVDSGVETSTKGVSVLDEYGQAKLNGYTGTREQWLTRNDLYYLWSASEEKLIAPKNMLWRISGVGYMRYKGFLFGDFSLQDWMKDWSLVMKEKSDRYPYLWAKVGVDGEPFLLQGMSGTDAYLFEISTDTATIVKDMRSSETQTISFSIQKSGYKGETVVLVSSGMIDGNEITIGKRQDSLSIYAYSIVSAYNTEFDSQKVYFKKDDNGVWTAVQATPENYIGYFVEEVRDSVTLSCVDETGDVIYLGVYDTLTSIPDRLLDGSDYIAGDYVLIDKPDGVTPKITLYEFHENGKWLPSESPEKLASTVIDAVNRAKEYSAEGIDYSETLWSHNAYIVNLSAAIINVGKINAGDILSFDYSEDEEGVPESGYKLEYKGGPDGKGYIKSVGMEARNSVFLSSTINRDCQVYGTLINQDEDGNVVLKTEQSNLSVSTMSSSRKDGVNNPNAFLWSSYSSLLKNRMTSRTANTIYDCTSTINGTSIKGYCNKTSVSDPPVQSSANVHEYSSGQTVDFPFGWTREESFGYTNKSSSQRVTIRIKVPENFPIVKIRKLRIASNEYATGQLWWQENHSEWYRLTVGSRQLAYFAGRSSGGSWSPSNTAQQEIFENVVAYPGETIVAEIGGMFGSHYGNFQISLYESDTWSTGLKLIGSNGTLYNFDSVVPSSGWGTSAQTFNDGGVNYSLSMEASSSWPVTKYYSFQWDSAPSSSTNKTTSFVAEGSSMSYNGTSLNYSQIGSATYSTKGITLVSNSGNSYQFSVGGYYSQYSVSLTTQDSLLGIYAKNLMPVDTNSRIGGSDPVHLWQSIYCNTIYSNNSAPVSRRSLKENIKEWNGNALSLLNEVDIVEYNYISDPDKTYHIGFIADDTDKRIAGENHDRMDVTNCIGVLIKAIQELNEKIIKLENRSIT